jgi:Tfp pilus assembly protein PilN
VRAVNLLPRDEPKKSFEASRGVVFGGVGGAALVTALLVSMAVGAGNAASEKQSELDGVHAQIAAIPVASPKDTSTEDALAAQKSARVGALSTALGSRVAWDRVLRQVSLVLPEDVWLTSLSATAPNAPTGVDAGGAPGPATSFTLTGSTYSQNGVARFLARLSVIPDLANVRLQSSQSALVNERELVQFTMLADVRAAGATTAVSGS